MQHKLYQIHNAISASICSEKHADVFRLFWLRWLPLTQTVFGHLQRHSKLLDQTVTLKDINGEPITDPSSQAEAFKDRFREVHRKNTGKPTPQIQIGNHHAPAAY